MSKVFACPHCQTQNFATRARLGRSKTVPLTCWKCGERIKRPKLISDKYEDKQLISKKNN